MARSSAVPSPPLVGKDSAFRETPIGTMPAEWRTAKLSELFEVQQGKAMSAESRGGPAPKPFLRTSNVLWGKINLSSVDKMHFTDEEARRFLLQPGDLLVCEGGEVGRAAVWGDELPGCLYQNHLHRLRRMGTNVEPKFIMYWLQEAVLHRNIYEGAANRTTIPNLSAARLKEFLVPLPDIEEQRAIAAVLSKIQAAAETQGKIVTGWRELRTATLRKLFRQGLSRSSKETEIGSIPNTWRIARLGEILELRRGYDLPAHQRQAGSVPVISSSGRTGRHSTWKVRGPGVVTGRYGTLGQVFYIEQDFWPLNTTLYVKDFKNNAPQFIALLLETVNYETHDDKSAVPGVNRNALHAQLIAIPPLAEQQEIARHVNAITQSLELADRRLAILKTIFESMLPLLITGQKRLPRLIH